LFDLGGGVEQVVGVFVVDGDLAVAVQVFFGAFEGLVELLHLVLGLVVGGGELGDFGLGGFDLVGELLVGFVGGGAGQVAIEGFDVGLVVVGGA
jgi:hypothetical protein